MLGGGIMKKIVIVLMFLTICSKIFGFGREIVLSYIYGASSFSDAYLIAITIPGALFAIIASGLTAGYIPSYNKILKENGRDRANIFTSNLINILILICSIIIIIVLLYTNQIVQLFASGFTGEQLKLTVQFTRISIIAIYFLAIISIFTGLLQINNKFEVPALIGFPLNIFVIISIVMSARFHIIILPIGFVVAIIAEFIFLLPAISKVSYKHSFTLDFKDIYLRNMLKNAMPVIIGISVNQINVLVDRTLASGIIQGGISALNYASKLNGFIQGIFVSSIITVIYPRISKNVVESDYSLLKKTLSEAIVGISCLVIPATIGAMIFSEQIVLILFGRGAFDRQAINMTAQTLFYYSWGMIGFGLREVLSRVFYAMYDTKTPMINAIIGMSINIVLNLVLSRYIGLSGLALATSIAALIITALMLVSLRKKIGPFGIKQITVSIIKILFASFIMGVFAKVSFRYLIAILSENLSLVVAIGIGVVCYGIIIYFMKIEDVDAMISAIKTKLVKNTV